MNRKMKSVLTAAALAGVTSAINSPTTTVGAADRAEITQEVVKAVEPIVANMTNQEPWYQSRVTWGAIITFASPVIGQIIGHQVTAEEQAMVVGIACAVGGAIGGILTLYGRWVAKRPIGQ